MKVAIIEDEKIAADSLAELLRETGMPVEIVAILDSVKKSVEWLAKNNPDLIMMDIQLGDDVSFSIFDQVEVAAPVIFTTAYDHYAIRAFKVNSIDYLLKPIDKKELKQALKKYESVTGPSSSELSVLLETLRKPEPVYQKRFMVTSGNKIRSLEAEQIACFYAEARYVGILAGDGSRHLTDHTLDKLESLLDPYSFFRINRSVIVNFDAIRQMHAYTKSRIKIDLQPDPGFEVIVSIDRSGDFKKWLNR